VQLDLAQGQVRLHGTSLITVSASALALCIGQVQPLAAYLVQRAQRPLDRSGLQAIYARAERLNQLAQLLDQTDAAVIDCFGMFRRA
jgi:hypothetical protein